MIILLRDHPHQECHIFICSPSRERNAPGDDLFVFVSIRRQAARDRSAFVSPDEVKEGLGPAGAFAGNSNWRVETSRWVGRNVSVCTVGRRTVRSAAQYSSRTE